MTDCKHDWHFVQGTDRLQCARCKAETGPRTYDQRTMDMFQDIATIGSAWSKGGERIDPLDVYKVPEYDTTNYLVPTSQVYALSNIVPNHNITLSNAQGQVGKLDFNGPQLVFTGEADKSAQVFLDWVSHYFDQRLKDERQAELNACCDLLEGMHVATDGNHNYYLHAANELRKLRAGK
jgi:hypothetical protein